MRQWKRRTLDIRVEANMRISQLLGVSTWTRSQRVGPYSHNRYDSDDVDSMETPFFIAHEFFDALPIHAFQAIVSSPTKPTTIQGLNGPIELKSDSTQGISRPSNSQLYEWRELVVTPTPPSSIITTSSRPALDKRKATSDFQLSVAKAPTRASLVIPETTPRYRALKNRVTVCCCIEG